MKKLSLQYLLFLAILTVAIVTSQILVQKTISDSKSDSRIINISGRQRMLSQKITKAALKLQDSKTREEYYSTKQELSNAAELWTQSHKALQFGNENIDVTDMNKSERLLELFVEIQPYYADILAAVEDIKKIGFSRSTQETQMQQLNQSTQIILDNEASFLKLMNDITFEYDRLASRKVEQLSISEYTLLAVALILILLEAFFIFRPMIKSAKKKETEISELHEYVQKSITFLGQTEQEKHYASSQINEANEKINELVAANYELKRKLNELENTKGEKKEKETPVKRKKKDTTKKQSL
ncbi:type IV pili methyl-accepting chemotaxis transducer N-terminal domain-containing protein [Reichenbachiella agarivorans]|uniref:Type IV pili methyl-accepting chemotaxis transducer N-terminal domain-containing protein n=1 Tax=Reichenbachiella agarivorans TaxID=2979464 RepID=A0ABY6CV89_9BACT|nr:type IV pili methyl-accepting chemotaxis transducer N-terminal domain-containing protein [Reichenbachiella agarivorans]UXP33298.1 type IV pili methyl-accepting chemotaxis transducer N-terminal domain-containing protein [Reichenbachiella agarivorans]